MKKRPVNLKRSDENIADQYTNIFEGVQKDAGQNAWDARLTKKGKDWKLSFRYLPPLNSLVIEDSGTTGMDNEKWIKYQSLWDTTKAEEDALGARGQGKFLFHYFSSQKLVLTETIDKDGNYRFSYGTSEEWDDEAKQLKDFFPGEEPLDHQGTRIWIVDIRKDLLDELIDLESFQKYIESTWWEIIRNYEVKFIVNFDSGDKVVGLPLLPHVQKEKSYQDKQIKNMGKIKKLIIRYCKEELPEHCRGIAIQRGGMAILRLPVVAEEGIRSRIYGYCNFDDELEQELKRIELPNHFGFTNKRAWNHVKDFVLRSLDEFLQEIAPKKEKLSFDDRLLSEAAKVVNEIVAQYAPELAEKGSKGEVKPPPSPPPPSPPKPPVRIDVFRGNARKIDYNETLITDCEIVNEAVEDKNLLLEFEVRHRDGIQKFHSKYSFLLTPAERKKVDIPLIDFVEGQDKPGQYGAYAVLKDAKTREELHSRRFVFYVHEEPPPTGKNFMATFSIIATGKNLYFERWRNLPITEKGIIRVIWNHPYFVHTREIAKAKQTKSREILLYLIKIGLDEAEKKLFEFRQIEGILDLESIKDIKQIHDQMYYDTFVRL